jgi:hypothetical protein
MNNGLLSDLIKKKDWRNSRSNEDGKFLEIEHPSFDKLFVCTEGYAKQVFAYKGKGVIYIRYHGNADMSSVINATAEKIRLISD